MTELKFLVHSKGDNWIHFRKDLNSVCESFTVTFIWDGTCVLSGDYGNLAWQRRWYPRKNNIDYGFPSKGDHIGYFAEKCRMADERTRIYEWNKELAIKQFKEWLTDYEKEENKAKECIEKFEWIEDYDEIEFMRILTKYYPEAWETTFGKKFTYQFTFQFQVLQAVSDQIFKELAKIEIKEEQKQEAIQ